ncbi:MAG: NADH-quinone oxidoreductase subunit NuoK [Pseudomonadota bacterium]|nr:NADH-quinone oxidoreductase subunit NuoK [Pseudomonadota bacterium]
MIVLEHYLVLSALVFTIGLMGMVFNRNNLIAILMSMELMLIAVNISFVAIDKFIGALDGQVMVFFILAVAASEAVIGLAIFIVLYQKFATVATDSFAKLRG